MEPAAAVAKTPVFESQLVPGMALTMDWAFSFGSTGVDKQRTPILKVSMGKGRSGCSKREGTMIDEWNETFERFERVMKLLFLDCLVRV